MNCDSLARLIEAVPMPQWTHRQQVSARDHCATCERCQRLLDDERVLFDAFAALPEFAPARDVELAPDAPQRPRRATPWLRAGTVAAALFLAFGSLLQLILHDGLSVSWFADGSRIEGLLRLAFDAPVFAIALTLVGVVFAFTREGDTA